MTIDGGRKGADQVDGDEEEDVDAGGSGGMGHGSSSRASRLEQKLSQLRLVGLTATPGVSGRGASVRANISALERKFGGYIFTHESVWRDCNRAPPVLVGYVPDVAESSDTSSRLY